MAKRSIVFLAVIALAGLAYFQLTPPKSTITVSDATASAMGANGSMFMVSLTMTNTGDAVALTDVTSPSGATVSVMNPSPGNPLVIPGGGQGLMAMDGAHMMLAVPDGAFEEGSFQSVSLGFSDGSALSARVLRPAQTTGMMHHGMSQGVEEDLPPSVAWASPPMVQPDGFEVNIEVENFTFVRTDDEAAHVPNEGHAHVYLNGLKLGRLYDTRYDVGALLAGEYTLRIALNSHDHRAYVADGQPVEVSFDFQVE